MDLRQLPQIGRLQNEPKLRGLRSRLGLKSFTAILRRVLSAERARLRSGGEGVGTEGIIARVLELGEQRLGQGLQRVINATGVVLHTNLGRAPLGAASVARLSELAAGYCTLEYDTELGQRSRRGAWAEASMAELVGAEDALIVNNNAAAVLLALSGLSAGGEVIVSRGELVEIGGGFRIPEVLERSGARMVEVGTTNRTRLSDYERALGERTAAILRVHPSNFKVTGFTERVALKPLAALARQHSLPLVKDLGGGRVIDLEPMGFEADAEAEPSVQQSLSGGASVVCFSLDKFFGGPQGGVVAGSAALVEKLRTDPLTRALRVDKLTLAALEPVLAAYLAGRPEQVPVVAMLATPLSELERRAHTWLETLRASHPDAELSVEHSDGVVGAGALAEQAVASVALVIRSADASDLAARLRRARPAVIARIHDDRVVLDTRTVALAEGSALLEAVSAALR